MVKQKQSETKISRLCYSQKLYTIMERNCQRLTYKVKSFDGNEYLISHHRHLRLVKPKSLPKDPESDHQIIQSQNGVEYEANGNTQGGEGPLEAPVEDLASSKPNPYVSNGNQMSSVPVTNAPLAAKEMPSSVVVNQVPAEDTRPTPAPMTWKNFELHENETKKSSSIASPSIRRSKRLKSKKKLVEKVPQSTPPNVSTEKNTCKSAKYSQTGQRKEKDSQNVKPIRFSERLQKKKLQSKNQKKCQSNQMNKATGDASRVMHQGDASRVIQTKAATKKVVVVPEVQPKARNTRLRQGQVGNHKSRPKAMFSISSAKKNVDQPPMTKLRFPWRIQTENGDQPAIKKILRGKMNEKPVDKTTRVQLGTKKRKKRACVMCHEENGHHRACFYVQ